MGSEPMFHPEAHMLPMAEVGANSDSHPKSNTSQGVAIFYRSLNVSNHPRPSPFCHT